MSTVSCPRGSRNKWLRLQAEGSLGEARNAGEDVVGALGPNEWFGMRMMRSDELANGHLQLAHASVDATTQLFVRELGKPALDEIEPGAVSRGEMDMEAGRLGEPVPNEGVLCVP